MLLCAVMVMGMFAGCGESEGVGKIKAFSIGDWACVTAPFEIFDTNCMAVRDASKFKMTFYASCANESHGYLPMPPSYNWAVTYEAQVTKYPSGTAELVQEQLIEHLR